MMPLPDMIGKIPMPNFEFNLVFMLNHIYRHLMSEIGIRQIIDYYVLLDRTVFIIVTLRRILSLY
jgi:hypothetical protein